MNSNPVRRLLQVMSGKLANILPLGIKADLRRGKSKDTSEKRGENNVRGSGAEDFPHSRSICLASLDDGTLGSFCGGYVSLLRCSRRSSI
jgi:hypothetical protein